MYENGKQLNHYACLMKHKHMMKKSYMRRPYNYRYSSWSNYTAHLEEFDSIKYWKTFYLSDAREYARYLSRKTIRQQFRQEKHHTDPEEMYAPQHSHYKKMSEFWWVIY